MNVFVFLSIHWMNSCQMTSTTATEHDVSSSSSSNWPVTDQDVNFLEFSEFRWVTTLKSHLIRRWMLLQGWTGLQGEPARRELLQKQDTFITSDHIGGPTCPTRPHTLSDPHTLTRVLGAVSPPSLTVQLQAEIRAHLHQCDWNLHVCTVGPSLHYPASQKTSKTLQGCCIGRKQEDFQYCEETYKKQKLAKI